MKPGSQQPPREHPERSRSAAAANLGPARRQGGFSLSELVISIGIIGSVMVVILGLLGTALSQSGSARLTQEAVLAARHVLGEIQAISGDPDAAAPLTASNLKELEWLFGPGLEPVDQDDAAEAMFRVTIETPASTTPSGGSMPQQGPDKPALQPVEFQVRYPWRGEETPDQDVERILATLRL